MKATVRNALLVLGAVALCALPAWGGRVERLPGFDGELPFEMHAGSFPVSPDKSIAYFLVRSERDPANDPLVLWMSGGPGCSSTAAWAQENGPLEVLPGGERLGRRRASWSRVATILHVDQPAGVGFSRAGTTAAYTTNDTAAAADMVTFVRALVADMPELLDLDWYITGESYGGVYVPLTTEALHEAAGLPLRLRGYAIGNGITVADTFYNFELEATFHHGLISAQQLETLVACLPSILGGAPNATCAAAAEAYEAGTRFLNLYGFSDWCATSLLAEVRPLNPDGTPPVGPLDPPCFDASDMRAYFDSPAARAALHMPTGTGWGLCEMAFQYTYGRLTDDVRPVHRRLLAAGIRGLVYSGVEDAVVSFSSTASWLAEMDLPQVRPFRVWEYDHPEHGRQVGGASRSFRPGGGAELEFTTMLGAGHLAPTDRPVASVAMLGAFLDGVPPGGNATCSGGCVAGRGACIARDVCVCADGFDGADCSVAVAPAPAPPPDKDPESCGGSDSVAVPVVITAFVCSGAAVALTVLAMRQRAAASAPQDVVSGASDYRLL